MKGKIVAILTVIMFIIVMYVPVFAATPIPDPPLGAYQYWVVAQSYGETYLLSSNNPITVEYSSNNILCFLLTTCRSYKFINNQWSYDREWLGQVQWRVDETYASNHNIEWSDGTGFFFTPPKVSTLYQTVRNMKSQGTFGKILKNFSAGLIPIIGLLILVISLRKGWEFLRTQLKH